ncbi:MAG: hypothetical protein FJ301_04865 [Planctomycetes bacterium]|nr:hypothetical protein [Planctomycetota bacterium]
MAAAERKRRSAAVASEPIPRPDRRARMRQNPTSRPPLSPMHHRSTVSLLATALALIAASQAQAQCTYTWNGNAAGADGTVTGVWDDTDIVHVVGRFTTFQGVPANRAVRFQNGQWQALGAGLNGDALSVLRLPNGEIVVGGSFTVAGASTANGIAKWDGANWSALGSGMSQQAIFGAAVSALAVLPSGDLVAGGAFNSAGAQPASNIARWNGTAWSALGAGFNGVVRGLAVTPAGALVAVGSFTASGATVVNGIAQWNGSQWLALGSGLGLFGGAAVATRPNGDILVGGSFVTAGGVAAPHVAQWSGGAWSSLGAGVSGPVTALAALPNGDLIVGGSFNAAGPVATGNLAKWNGATWTGFGSGTNGLVQTIGKLRNGNLAIGGDFAQANGVVSPRFVNLDSSCAASVVATGAGCAGQGGVPALAVSEYPMLGQTFRSRCTNLPPLSIVLGVLGLAPTALPLAIALPQAGAGCTLYANPDVVDALVPAAGAATYALAIPNVPALVGTQLHHQYVPLAFDFAFNLVGASASNAVQANVGSF